jgi:hypothetical protein
MTQKSAVGRRFRSPKEGNEMRESLSQTWVDVVPEPIVHPKVHKWRWATVRHWTIGFSARGRPRLHVTIRLRRSADRISFLDFEL